LIECDGATVVNNPAYNYYLYMFIDPTPTVTYSLSLHDALPISAARRGADQRLDRQRLLREPRLGACGGAARAAPSPVDRRPGPRSEEHTSELQSRENLVCRLLLEKKKYNTLMIATVKYETN